MRRFYAWLLLVVSTVQWVGGHICFEVAHFAGLEVAMDAPEQSISNEIFEKTGLETTVNILPEGQHTRVGADYGNYFAYSKTDSTGTVFYTIDYAPRTVTWEQVASHIPESHKDDAAKTNLLKLLYAEFLFPKEALPKGDETGLCAAHFILPVLVGSFTIPTLSPPPDFIC